MARAPLPVVIALALAALGTATKEVAAQQSHDLLDRRTKGSLTAPILVVEMSDFQCPWCHRFTAETSGLLDREYVATGKVRWVFLNFPITQLHPNAGVAAELAMCSAAQGQFWPMHDILYRQQDTWAPLREPEPYFLTLVDSLRIPRDSILPCLRDGRMREAIQHDLTVIGQAGARSTPSFWIEGVMISGAYPVAVFRHVLDSIYAVKTASPPR